MHIKVGKKRIEIIAIAIIIIVLMAFNSDNPDYANYLSRYNRQDFGGMEGGFGVINRLFYKLGFSFIQFRAFVYIIGSAAIFYSINKITLNLRFVVVAYLLVIMSMDAIQLRNYIASVIIIFAMPYLLRRNIKSDIIFAIFCLASMTIHVSSIYYFLLLICRHVRKPRKYFYFMTMMCFGLIVMTYAGVTGRIINRFLRDGRTYTYTQSRAAWGIMVYFAVFIVTAVLIKYSFREKMFKHGEFELFEDLRDSDLFILNLFITLIPVLGLMCMNAIFVRLIRSMFVFMFAFLGNTFMINKKLSVTKTKIIFWAWMFFVIIWFYGGAFKETYLYILTNNFLFGG